MPLPTPALDDRTFQDIVDEAKRLIPRYCPEWTNHNVSDPGVALIELFAWMSEMVLYRVNQVPDRLYVHFLNLVGIEPFPPSVARTDLTFWLSAVLEQPVLVPANTQVMTQTSLTEGEGVIFSTASDLVIAPPNLVAAKSSAANSDQVLDVWEDLRFGTDGARCFPSETLTPGDALYLGFRESLAGMVLRLQDEARAEGIGVDPRNPPLVWEVWNGEGGQPARVHEDTTGGLNRPGEVVLRVPVEHQPLTLANESAHWLRCRLLATRDGQPTYRNSPRVRGIEVAALGGTVSAEHAETVGSETLGRSSVSVRAPTLPREPPPWR